MFVGVCEQIIKTQDEPQWIVTQGLLSHLQYLDSVKPSAKDLWGSRGREGCEHRVVDPVVLVGTVQCHVADASAAARM